ncbi:transmembrane protein 170B isoform X2 [Panthera tigris]|uniref:transmembrane protein 170B isoform X2 n=1 Tax=Panthera tigris TaxID=9694 RepID=UPI001C6FA262|nr:transmembrane protein 170B isoform X2 [Panthera tigris]
MKWQLRNSAGGRKLLIQRVNRKYVWMARQEQLLEDQHHHLFCFGNEPEVFIPWPCFLSFLQGVSIAAQQEKMVGKHGISGAWQEQDGAPAEDFGELCQMTGWDTDTEEYGTVTQGLGLAAFQ